MTSTSSLIKRLLTGFSGSGFTRRKNFYNRCQSIIDDLHNRVKEGERLSPAVCCKLYGIADYRALEHELHLMDAASDTTVMTPAMEWLYSTQYFSFKAEEERRNRVSFYLAIAAFVVSVVSAVFAGAAFFR